MRAEVQSWGLDAPGVDPGETLLRLLAQAAARAARYADLLQAAYDGADDFPERFRGSGIAALIGHRYATTEDGDRVEVAEVVRGLVDLEAQERDRCARFAKLALDAGLEERRVRLAEHQGAMVLGAMHLLIDGLLARGLVAAENRGELLELSGAALRQIDSIGAG